MFLTVFSLSALCFSCSNDDDVTYNQFVPETLSGVLTHDAPRKTVSINGHNITLELGPAEVSGNRDRARASHSARDGQIILEEKGPFYSHGTPKALSGSEYKNRKIAVPTGMGVPAGVYFGDVWETRNSMTLPDNAYSGRVEFPDPAGCKEYTNLSRGVNWKLTSTSNGQIVITWWFYTFVLNYNSVGQRISEVIPLDGADVNVPYYYTVKIE